MDQYKKIYVLGAGAVGCYFGGMLARAHHDVTLIARPDRANAISENGLEMDCTAFHELVKLKVASDTSALKDADLVLLSVKSTDTEQVSQEVSNILPSKAILLSLQNGVANTDIASRYISNPIYPAVVYVACAMDGLRTMKHHGRGELQIGAFNATNQDNRNLISLSMLFEKAHIPCAITSNIKREMWVKFLVNCSYNAISAIGQRSYGEMVKIPEIRELIKGITNEFLAVANFEGVNISNIEANEANHLIASTMATQLSSTAQDLAKNKKTEIDFLNGYIVQLGRKYGVPIPFNESMYALIKMLENKGR